MRFHELDQNTPQKGDVLQIEAGDTLIETTIIDVTHDGIVVQLDRKSTALINEAPLKDSKSPVYARSKSRVLYDPDYRPMKDFNTADYCDEVVQWAIDIFSKLDVSVRRFLSISGEATIIKFLKDSADQSDAYSRYGFGPDDIETCQDYLPNIVQDAGVQSWEDYLKFRLHEAEYQGRKVPLGKPMKGDVKKSKVYVKNAKGKVVKVNFGDKNMKIKKSNPKRRKSFRARHNCANPGPRWKARYWSCRAW